MSWIQFAALTTVMALGSLLQGGVGFGLGLFAVPLLILIDPRLVPGPILLSSGALTLLMVHREWHAIRVEDLKWSLSGRMVGTLAALAVLVLVPPSAIGIVFAGLILAAVGLTASGLHPKPVPSVLLGAGVLSGFMATTVSIGGPPMALLYQRESGPSIRATLSAFFVIGTLLSLVGLHFVGRFGWLELTLTGALLPGTLFGFLASRYLTRVMDRGLLRPAILVVSALTALGVVAKELW